jgi:PAP2 superfamily protein
MLRQVGRRWVPWSGRRLARGLTAAGWRREALVFLAAYLVYELARSFSTGTLRTAVGNAHRVLDVERATGSDVERAVQHAFLGTPWIRGLDWLYLGAQSVALAVGIVLVYRRSRPVYRVLRGTVIGTWMLALPVYALFPTAPPRLAGIGLSDTVSAGTAFSLDSHATTLFYNPYAAVPSLHCGFALALGLAVAASTRGVVRVVGCLWGPLVVLAVLATGNHFVLDVVAGVVLTLAGLGIWSAVDRLWRRRRAPGPPQSARRSTRSATSSLGTGSKALTLRATDSATSSALSRGPLVSAPTRRSGP